MLFNSIDFAIFLPVVFVLYWFVANKNLKIQNLLIVGASYLFYGWWDYRFLLLIIFSTLVDYFVGLELSKEDRTNRRKTLLWISILINLGFLGFFKYYNFFLDNFVTAFSFFGTEISSNSLNIILPVGISFYTFQTLSYTIDVYKRNLKPTTDFIGFAAFVSFFPQLVAGPIERATNLLPQILTKRKFSYNKSIDGITLILWGLFKKIVVGDNLAPAVNDVFMNYESYSGDILILGAVFFAFQIYCDFSGYSDIARGVAKLFGIELMVNFNFPYFSRNIGEFWRKWHISLSTWFRDYLYIPLGGSKVGKSVTIRNVFIIFIVSGFWHGANWTFISWGAVHALLFIPSLLFGTNRKYVEHALGEKKIIPSFGSLIRVLATFSLVTLAWVFFRADSISMANSYIAGMFHWFDHADYLNPYDNQAMTKEYIILILFILVEYFLNAKKLPKLLVYRPFRMAINISLLVLIIIYNPISQKLAFIYFQF